MCRLLEGSKQNYGHQWRTPKLFDGLNSKSKGENNGRRRSGACSPAHSTSGVERCARVSRWGLRRLIHDPSFGHNLCFKCLNGSCAPILDIYIPRAFQWYKELFNPMGFDPAIAFWRFKSPSKLQFPKWDLTWECEGLFLHILIPMSMRCDSRASLLAHTFASPCLGHEPKIRVAITNVGCYKEKKGCGW